MPSMPKWRKRAGKKGYSFVQQKMLSAENPGAATVKEQRMTYKCLNDNDYDREKCTKQFQNYKNCKEFWNIIVLRRQKDGTKPYLPPPDERPQIFKDNQEIFSWI